MALGERHSFACNPQVAAEEDAAAVVDVRRPVAGNVDEEGLDAEQGPVNHQGVGDGQGVVHGFINSIVFPCFF